jgi:hypothetical protein
VIAAEKRLIFAKVGYVPNELSAIAADLEAALLELDVDLTAIALIADRMSERDNLASHLPPWSRLSPVSRNTLRARGRAPDAYVEREQGWHG